MEKKIIFSVIIPTYNRSNSLIEAIKSVLNQTYKNFEIIVCDDGSTINTEEIINKFKKANIKLVKIKRFGGPSRPRNIAIAASSGN